MDDLSRVAYADLNKKWITKDLQVVDKPATWLGRLWFHIRHPFTNTNLTSVDESMAVALNKLSYRAQKESLKLLGAHLVKWKHDHAETAGAFAKTLDVVTNALQENVRVTDLIAKEPGEIAPEGYLPLSPRLKADINQMTRWSLPQGSEGDEQWDRLLVLKELADDRYKFTSLADYKLLLTVKDEQNKTAPQRARKAANDKAVFDSDLEFRKTIRVPTQKIEQAKAEGTSVAEESPVVREAVRQHLEGIRD